MKTPRTKNEFTVSGPGIDRTAESGIVGLSVAINACQRAPEGSTVYVRDPKGDVFGYVESVAGAWNVHKRVTP